MHANPAHFTLHPPSVLLLCAVVMGSAAAIMSVFGLTHRVYRGYWWWTAAMWLASIGGLLQLLRPLWPAAVLPGNLLLLAWPVLVVTGLRRHHNRGRLPSSSTVDWMLLLLCYVVWLAAWASPALQGARTPLFCAGLAVLHCHAALFIARMPGRRDSAALRSMVVVMLVQTLVPVLVVCTAALQGASFAPGHMLLLPVVTVPTMIAMLFTVYLCLALTHERTERDLRETQRQLRMLADIDMLTQVPNRRHVEELAGAVLGDAPHDRAALVLFDIDHFKQINDEHGHAIGDEALKRVARCTREMLRSHDVFGRIGGDEFLLLLPGAQVDEALLVADRITRCLDGDHQTIRGAALSLSFGVVEIEPGEPLEAAQRRADMALYEAKRQGRKRAVPARQDGPDTVFGESRSLGLAPVAATSGRSGG